MEKVGRNDLCPCGSGKKYKKCCGKHQDVVFINEIIMQEVLELQNDIMHYALTYYEEELGSFLMRRTNHFLLDREFEAAFMFYITHWALFCEPFVNGRTIIADYIQKHVSRIKRPAVRSILQSWSDVVPSFTRIVEKESSDRVVVEDILSNERKNVTIVIDDQKLEIGSLLIGLLVPMGATYTFFPTCVELEEKVAAPIIEQIKKKFEQQPTVSSHEFVATSFPELLYECFPRPLSESFTLDELRWEHPIHEVTAHLLEKKMNERHGEETLTKLALILWHTYCDLEKPVIKKPKLYAAAVHYLVITTTIPYKVVTQKEIAEYYGVSSVSLSAKYREMEDVLADFIEQAYEKMEDLDIDDFDDTEDMTSTFNPFQHSRLSTERELRKVHRAVQGKDFSSMQEANKYIEAAINSEEDDRAVLSPKESAQELLYDAFKETNRKKRLELARKALNIYPNIPDAYNILGEEAVTLKEAADYYKKGMEVGEKDLGKRFFRENKGHFWGTVETRPYMRAKANYAQTLWLLGEKEKAIEQYEQLLNLNPNDNQGIRYLLLPAYLELKRYNEAEELMEQYDEPTAIMAYNRLLLAYLKYGLHEEMEDLLDQAIDSNPYVINYLLKKKRVPSYDPPFFGLGDENEAIVYAKDHLHLWQQERELLKWLRTIAR